MPPISPFSQRNLYFGILCHSLKLLLGQMFLCFGRRMVLAPTLNSNYFSFIARSNFCWHSFNVFDFLFDNVHQDPDRKPHALSHDPARSRFCGRLCPDMAARCFHGRSLPPMFASPRRSSCARMFTNIRPWRFGNFVWILGKKHCALKFENKQGFGTCPKSFFGGKKCKTSSLWFRIHWVQISGVLHIRIRG